MKKIFIGSASGAEHTQTAYQSTIVYEFFKQNGYVIVNEPKDSNVILLNGYPFDNYEEKLALLSINYYLNKYGKEKEIIVFGSIPDMIYGIRSIKEITFISYSQYHIFDNLFKHNISILDIEAGRIKFFIPLKIEGIFLGDLLHNHLGDNISLRSDYELTEKDLSITVEDIINKNFSIDRIEEYPGKLNYMDDEIENYYVETTRGCGFKCSYCAIQRVSGFTKSFPIEKIISNIKKGLSSGAKNIIIIDEDCGSYGIDIGKDFSFLVNEINKIELNFKVKFYYLEPGNLERNYEKIDKSFWINKVSYIRITLQTTSQRILKLMNRSYDIEKVLSISEELKKMNTNMLLGAIVIYGFPTETYEEFKDFFRLLKYFDCIDFLCYADKEGTKSYKMQKNSLDEITKKSLTILKIKEKYPEKIDPVIDSFIERKKLINTCYFK